MTWLTGKFNRGWNPYYDQYHRTTRIPAFSVVSVIGSDSELNFTQKALSSHQVLEYEHHGQTASELLAFANKVSAPTDYEKKSGYLVYNFPANLQQAQEYEGMTDGLNLVVTTKGNTSPLVEYYKSRGVLMQFEYNGEESEQSNMERFTNEFACAVKH